MERDPSDGDLLAYYPMTVSAVPGGAHVVIWAVVTVAASFSSTEFYRPRSSALGQYDSTSSSVRPEDPTPSPAVECSVPRRGGKTIGHYDKIRLVPLGETSR